VLKEIELGAVSLRKNGDKMAKKREKMVKKKGKKTYKLWGKSHQKVFHERYGQ
jgi:hypothetical protein